MSEYADREPWDLEPHFSKHMMAMTAENLHSKAAIAEELAYRDQQIEHLKGKEREAFMAGRNSVWNGDDEQAWQQYRCQDDTDWQTFDDENLNSTKESK